jgi:hypothetical protein
VSAGQLTPTKARLGAWTPWAQVLCNECDYACLKSTQTFEARREQLASMDRSEEVAQPDPDSLAGTCDSCGRPCWVRDDVALLQQVGRRAGELGAAGFVLEQTGGMCAALSAEAGDRRICLTAMDGGFMLGEYELNRGEEWWEHLVRTWDSGQIYEDGAWKGVEGAIEECARKVVEFIHHPAAPSKEGA